MFARYRYHYVVSPSVSKRSTVRAGLWSTGTSQSLPAGLKVCIVFLEIFTQAYQHINREGFCGGSPYCAHCLRQRGKKQFRALSQSLNEKSCSPEDWGGSERNSGGQLSEMHEKIKLKDWMNCLHLEKELGRAKMPRVYLSPEGRLSNRLWTALAEGCCIIPSDNSYLLLHRDCF